MEQEQFDKICRKLDKIQHMLTVTMKALHLLPVTEEEEKKIQIAQRRNLAQTAKVNNDLNAIQNKSNENQDGGLTVKSIGDMFGDNIYEGLLGDDIMGTPKTN